jgi:hypothetical protein
MKPDRAIVEAIARDEAMRSRCTLDELLHMHRRPEAKAARIRAWARIIAETNCKGSELAEVWGCQPASIHRAFPERYARRWKHPEPAPEPPRSIYEGMTKDRLLWAYGSERTAAIVAGEDPATNADIAAWNRIGSHARSAA